MEFLQKLVKYEEKTGRKAYLFNVLALIAIQMLLVAVLFVLLTLFTKLVGSALAGIIAYVIGGILGLGVLYLGFVTSAKRIWDLTGDKMCGIWYTVGLFVASFIPFVNALTGLAAIVFLFFIPGKDAE